jgi:hypothetical protein
MVFRGNFVLDAYWQLPIPIGFYIRELQTEPAVRLN